MKLNYIKINCIANTPVFVTASEIKESE